MICSYFHENTNRVITADVVIVDEIFNVPMKWIFKLIQNCDAKIIVLGDNRQCLPVDTVRYDYLYCNTFINFFNNIVNLSYKEGSARFDKDLYDVTKEFRKTGKLPEILKEHVYTGLVKYNICKTNSTRKRINQLHNPDLTFKVDNGVICLTNNKNLNIF